VQPLSPIDHKSIPTGDIYHRLARSHDYSGQRHYHSNIATGIPHQHQTGRKVLKITLFTYRHSLSTTNSNSQIAPQQPEKSYTSARTATGVMDHAPIELIYPEDHWGGGSPIELSTWGYKLQGQLWRAGSLLTVVPTSPPPSVQGGKMSQSKAIAQLAKNLFTSLTHKHALSTPNKVTTLHQQR